MSQQSHIPQPSTIQDEPWTNFPKLSYSFINEHFVHDHRGSLKLNLKGTTGGAQIKETVISGEKGHYIHDETKFWFGLPGNRSLFAKFRTGQNIKIHFDNGNSELYGRTFNFYATLNFSRQINHLSWRFGIAHYGNKCHTDNRLRIDTSEQRNIIFYNRTLITQGKFSYGFIATYDFVNRLVGKNSLLFGLNLDQRTSIYVRAQNQRFRSTPIQFDQWRHYFDHVLIDIINKYDSNTNIGLEFAFQAHGKPFKEALIVLGKEINSKWTSKYKFTSNFDVYMLFKTTKFFQKQNGVLSFGIHGSNLLREHRKFNYGTQLQFNL